MRAGRTASRRLRQRRIGLACGPFLSSASTWATATRGLASTVTPSVSHGRLTHVHATPAASASKTLRRRRAEPLFASVFGRAGTRTVGRAPLTQYSAAEVSRALENEDDRNNVPASVKERVGRRLLHEPGHPLWLIKEQIAAHFGAVRAGAAPPTDVSATTDPAGDLVYELLDDLSPIVTVEANFDQLLTPADHVSRSPSDTYYVGELDGSPRLLRCHTSAHQTEVMRAGKRAFLVAGDVYRRDTVDATHYPVFHQMEGVRIFSDEEVPPSWSRADKEAYVVSHLQATLNGLVGALFGDTESRWLPESFPFTDPSLELEVVHDGAWLEVLGCGMIHDGVLKNAGLEGRVGWAFGLGLERLAMRLFNIPDIRLFWTKDERFLSQFSHLTPATLHGTEAAHLPGADGLGTATPLVQLAPQFAPYSKFPPCYKDITFWVPATFHAHDFHELARTVGGDLVESVECIDIYNKTDKATNTTQTSHCYRVNYRSMDRSLTNEEVDALQMELRDRAVASLNVTLR